MEQEIEEFLDSCKQRGLKPLTLYVYALDLRLFSGFLRSRAISRWRDLSEGELVEFLKFLVRKGFKVSTVIRKLRVARIFLRWMFVHGDLDRLFHFPSISVVRSTCRDYNAAVEGKWQRRSRK